MPLLASLLIVFMLQFKNAFNKNRCGFLVFRRPGFFEQLEMRMYCLTAWQSHTPSQPVILARLALFVILAQLISFIIRLRLIKVFPNPRNLGYSFPVVKEAREKSQMTMQFLKYCNL
jgi:hypothetical protein